jgi:hypothetical protein
MHSSRSLIAAITCLALVCEEIALMSTARSNQP